MKARLVPSDLIFVSSEWRTTPVFYYLNASQLVAGDFAAAVAARPDARVWIVLFNANQPAPEMLEALAGFILAEEVTALRARSRLYVPTAALRGASGD